MPFSAKGLLKDLQIQTQTDITSAASDKIDAFSRSLGITLPTAVRGKNVSIAPTATRQDRESLLTWDSVSYATGLSGTNFRPKLKCMFKVKFDFTEDFKSTLTRDYNVSMAEMNDFTFAVKSSDRPKISFEYEDDINKYNFRTKVLKKITHRDITMVFHDDVGNRMFTLFSAIMTSYLPIMRRALKRDKSLEAPSVRGVEALSGMDFIKNDTNGRSMRDAYGEDAQTTGLPISSIRLQQIFFDNSEDIDNAVKMVSFDFMNPKISAFDLDEVSYEQTDASSISLTFDYEWMEVVNVGFLGGEKTAYTEDQKQQFSASGYREAPKTDIDPKKSSGASPSPKGKAGRFRLDVWEGDLQNARNDRVDPSKSILDKLEARIAKTATGILGRGAQTLTSDLVGKAVKIAGGGRFATQLGGVFSDKLGGIAGATVKDLVTKNRGDAPSYQAWTPPSKLLNPEPNSELISTVSSVGPKTPPTE